MAPTPHSRPVELGETTRRRQSRQVPSFLYKIQQSINVLSLSLQSYSRKVCIACSGHCFIGGQTKTSTRMEGPRRRRRALHSRQVLVLLFLKSLPVADFFLLPPVVWSPGLLFIIMQQMSRRVEIMEANSGEGTS